VIAFGESHSTTLTHTHTGCSKKKYPHQHQLNNLMSQSAALLPGSHINLLTLLPMTGELRIFTGLKTVLIASISFFFNIGIIAVLLYDI